MTSRKTLATAVTLAASALAAPGNPLGPDWPPGGTRVVSATPDAAAWSGFRHERGSVEIVDGAWRATSVVRVDPWMVEFGWPSPVAWTKGEVAVVRFRARTVASEDETGVGQLTVFLQRNGEPHEKELSRAVALPRDEWRTVVLAARVARNYGPNGCALRLNLGMARQTLEIASAELWKFPPETALAAIPSQRATYAGREPDAPWRAAADARIERLRKADLAVRVVDAAGNPVQGATVRLAMQRHSFPFGSAFPAQRLVGTTDDDRAFQRKVETLFNAGTFENDLKWPPWEGGWGGDRDTHRARVREALAWCAARGLALRGHVMVWPSFQHIPQRLRALRDPAAMQAAVLEHIDDLAAATASDVQEWDVVNEPWNNHDLMDLCGREAMVAWFRRARERLPNAKLFLNDFGILTPSRPDAHQDFLFKTATGLREQGAPLDGLGFQGHFGADPPSIAAMWTTLERFAPLGLALRITEFDLSTDDEALQADFQRDLMTLCFSHPSVAGFQFWGFWEGSHWKPECAMYRRDWSEKPNGVAYRDLVFDRWWSRGEATADAGGNATFRVFKGRHSLVAEHGGRRVELVIDASGERAEAVLVLQPGSGR